MMIMVLGKRVVAIIVMALMSTASPAVYQKVLQPTIDGLNCNISISDLVLDKQLTYAKNNTVFFQAYLSIQNLADVDVVLSPLSLDVYHYSEKDGRYRLIGSFNTSRSISVRARETITATQNVNTEAMGILVLDEAADEAIAQLIRKRSVELTMKGVATVGPFTFQYEKKISLNTNFFDPNFIIVDVFNYYPESGFDKFPVYDQIGKTTDTNVFVVRAKFRNPSGIPMTLSRWTFDVYGQSGKIATGIPIEQLVYAYDPDFIDNRTGTRRTL